MLLPKKTADAVVYSSASADDLQLIDEWHCVCDVVKSFVEVDG